MPLTTELPLAGYMANAGRTQAEMKDALESFLAAARETVGLGGAWSTLTIAAGAIAPTLGEHLVDTEAAGAADDLTHVGQGTLEDGRLLILRSASATRAVVVKHAAGGVGQVSITDAADLTLADPSMVLILRRNGAQWDEVARSWGNQKVAFRTRYDLATLTQAPNTFQKTQEWAQGANLPSATTVALGTDGNFFIITGATAIGGLSAKTAGTRVVLHFAGPLSLVHNAASFVLASGASRQVAGGEQAEFISLGAGNWRELGGVGGNRALLTSGGPIGTGATVETAILSVVIPGGSILAHGIVRLAAWIRVTGANLFSFGITGTSTLTLLVKFGGVQIASQIIKVVESNIGSGNQLRLIDHPLLFILEIAGASSPTAHWSSRQVFGTSVLDSVNEQVLDSRPVLASNSVDTTVDQTLQVTAQFSGIVNGQNSMTLVHADVTLKQP